jgi:hypothetical protein
MAIDAGIYSQIQQPQQQNPLAMMAQAYQVKNLQRQGDQADMAAQQQNKLLQLVGGQDFQKMDTTGRASALQGVGAFEQAGSLVRSDAAASKDKREAEKFQLESTLKKVEAMGQIMGGVRDQASYDIARQQAAEIFGPEAAANIPPIYNPAEVAQKQTQALALKEQLAQKWKAMEFTTPDANAVLQANTSRANNQATIANSARTADMTDARSREANQNGRVPTGYRQTADGTLEFIPGGPADPSAAKKAAPTEFQGKSAIFGARAQEADRILSGLGTDFSPAAINAKNAVSGTPLIGGALEAGANVMLSDGSQKAEQAQRDFINAVLRLESGAAIGKDEFTNAKKQYFPQPGDSADVIAQKASNRKLQIQGLLGNAGNAPIPQTGGAKPVGVPKNKPATGVLSVTTAEDYAKVPSGATYTTPDGKMRRKP